MKLKYSITRVDSTTDDIYVRSYGRNVFEVAEEISSNFYIEYENNESPINNSIE